VDVDQAGEDDESLLGLRRAQVDHEINRRVAARGWLVAARRSRLAGADTDDPAVGDFDPSVPDWRRVDGQNPCGAMDTRH
jgi:hypothetical protein